MAPDRDNKKTSARRLISIGVLAHNEVGVIDHLLSDLARQSIFQRSDLEVRLHVVANGCTDGTVDHVRSLVLRPSIATTISDAHVHDVERRGKANAWNLLIHQLVDPTTSFVVMIDADIRIPEIDSCELVINRLIERPDVMVAIDRVVSDLSLLERPSVLDRVLLAATGTEHDSANSITGHFYCGRLDVLRSIRLPSGIIGEDGYLRAMVLTSNLAVDEDFARLSLVSEARHVYASEKELRSVFHHQVRQTMGTITNIVLFGHLRSVDAHEPDLAAYVDRRNVQDPAWLPDMVAQDWPHNVGKGTRRRFLLRRFSGSKFGLIQTPLRVVLTLIDLVTYTRAMQKIRSGRAAGFW
jgi:glycosyltransferase involved in cell wall biosynthesis